MNKKYSYYVLNYKSIHYPKMLLINFGPSVYYLEWGFVWDYHVWMLASHWCLLRAQELMVQVLLKPDITATHPSGEISKMLHLLHNNIPLRVIQFT